MCQFLRHQPLLRIWGLLTVLFQTLKEQAFVQVRWRRKSMKFTCSYRFSCKTRQGSKIAPKRLLRQGSTRQLRLQILNKLLGALWLASLLWKQMQLLVPVAPDSTRSWNMLGQSTGSTATGSLGPHGFGLKTRRRLDTSSSTADEHVRSAVLLRFLANSTTKGLQSGAIIFGKNPMCQPTIDLSEFIVKQVPRRSGLHLKHEPNVKILLLDVKMMDPLRN